MRGVYVTFPHSWHYRWRLGHLYAALFTSLDGQWNVAALTIPIVWLVSLAARTLAQWLLIGSDVDFELVVGPTGNISSDYDQLTGANMITYAMAGQSVTLVISLIGFFLLGTDPSSPGLTLATILELQTGWHWHAWASQIVWVNTFLFAMHFCPRAVRCQSALCRLVPYFASRRFAWDGAYVTVGADSHIGRQLPVFRWP